jgi:hypothetical protein
MDDQRILRFLGEADPVVSNAQPQLSGISPELFDIALAGLREAM